MILASLFLLAATTAYSPSDSNILYVGRFDRTDKNSPTCEWPASEVRLKVRGTEIVATLQDASGSPWELVIDGEDKGPLPVKKGLGNYPIELPGAGDHEVRLVRRVESFMMPTSIKGFQVDNGRLLKARPRPHHIEVIGDSISCGYGNEGKDQHERFHPETENAYESYASIAARMLDADVTIVAWSGKKMWPDNTIPELYDRVVPTQPEPRFDFKGPIPQAVVINLATNDFGVNAPEESGWTKAYEDFIRRVWTHYPKAPIYVASGSMMYGESLITLKRYMEKILADMNDPRVHLIHFDQQNPADGFGADWHPNVKTHHKMGEYLAQTLSHDLKWPLR